MQFTFGFLTAHKLLGGKARKKARIEIVLKLNCKRTLTFWNEMERDETLRDFSG